VNTSPSYVKTSPSNVNAFAGIGFALDKITDEATDFTGEEAAVLVVVTAFLPSQRSS